MDRYLTNKPMGRVLVAIVELYRCRPSYVRHLRCNVELSLCMHVVCVYGLKFLTTSYHTLPVFPG